MTYSISDKWRSATIEARNARDAFRQFCHQHGITMGKLEQVDGEQLLCGYPRGLADDGGFSVTVMQVDYLTKKPAGQPAQRKERR